MIPTDEILEALELPRAEPGIGYLQSLFVRFNERVAFESASKIVRNFQVADPAEKPRRPEVFWADHLASGSGGTCVARAAAFDALLADLGFESRVALGRVQEDFDHAALLVKVAGEEWICDVGFPLPVLLPGGGGELESPLGAVRVTRGPRGWRIKLLGGVPEGPREIEIFAAPVASGQLDDRWRATFRPDSSFLSAVKLRLPKQGRVVSYAAGEIRVDDLHSRTSIGLPAPRAALLAEQFGIDRPLLERAFALVGDPEPETDSTRVTVYLEADVPAQDAFAAIASPQGYRALMDGAAAVTEGERGPSGWRVRLSPPGPGGTEAPEASVEEDIAVDESERTLRVRRGNQESSYEVLLRGEKTFLARRLVLPGPRLDLLRNDSLRGRFAGSLAVDLLAWARLLGKSP